MKKEGICRNTKVIILGGGLKGTLNWVYRVYLSITNNKRVIMDQMLDKFWESQDWIELEFWTSLLNN